MGNKKGKPKQPEISQKTDCANDTEKHPETKQINLKFFILGEYSVGKTSLALKFVKDTFDEELSKSNNHISHSNLDSNCGGNKVFQVNDTITANIIHFDTAGNEKFRSGTITPFAKANIIFICFAINNSESFNQLSYWHREATSNTRDTKPHVVLVGTKQDLESDRRISQEEAEKFCKSHQNSLLQYFEVSAKTGYNIKELYTSACNEFLRKIEAGLIPDPFEDDDY